MIPIASLRKDAASAFFVVTFSVGLLVLAHNDGLVVPSDTPQITTQETQPLQPATAISAVIDTALPTPTSTESADGTSTTVLPTTQISPTPAYDAKTPVQTKTTAPAAPRNTASTATVTTPPASAITATKVSDAAYIAKLTSLIHTKTNLFRKQNQLTALRTDATLTRNATTYSTTLLAGNFLAHIDKKGCDLSCRFARDEYGAWNWGENLAVLHFTDQPTPEYVAAYFIRAWEKSAGHRANLLTADYTNTGIGVAMSDTDIYVTVQFAKPQ